MTIDEAVRSKVEQILSSGGFCTKEQAKKISDAAAKESRDQFTLDMKEMSIEIDKIRERNDKLHDLITSPPLKKFPKLRACLAKYIAFGWIRSWRE